MTDDGAISTPSWIAHAAEGWCRDCGEVCDGDDPDGMPCHCCARAERDANGPPDEYNWTAIDEPY